MTRPSATRTAAPRSGGDGRQDAAPHGAQHGPLLGALRWADPRRSVGAKLSWLVVVSVCIATFMVALAINSSTGLRVVLVFSLIGSLLITQLLAHAMTTGLREMREATQAMAAGDYSRRVTPRSRDEIGGLAHAFNRMAEDLSEADRLRRELIANVSHELRTPISALQGVLENVVDGVVKPEPEAMSAALEQTERLGRLVAHLLDLSKLADGVDALELRPFEVAPFVAGVVRGLTVDGSTSGGASRRRADVRLHPDVPAELTALADPERLYQVLANLVDNACRHSPPDGTVTIRACAGDTPGGLLLEVADQGPGIAPADRTLVFERFGRGSGASAHGPGADGGTGLGLAIARWAVELHGGTIGVVDTDTGCLIRVTLPGHRIPAPTPAPTH